MAFLMPPTCHSLTERYSVIASAARNDRLRPVFFASFSSRFLTTESTRTVKVVEGAFSGLEAVVTQVVPARERVKILMDFLGRKVEAELEHDSVLLKVEHPLVA